MRELKLLLKLVVLDVAATNKSVATGARPRSYRGTLGLIVAAHCLGYSLVAPRSAAAACPGTNLGSTLPVSVGGSTAGAANLVGGASCGGGGTNAPDASFLYTAPATGSYTIDTSGSSFDTILYARSSTCTGTELGCND